LKREPFFPPLKDNATFGEKVGTIIGWILFPLLIASTLIFPLVFITFFVLLVIESSTFSDYLVTIGIAGPILGFLIYKYSGMFYDPAPDVFEHGIHLSKDRTKEMPKREFLPFSDMEVIVTDPSPERLEILSEQLAKEFKRKRKQEFDFSRSVLKTIEAGDAGFAAYASEKLEETEEIPREEIMERMCEKAGEDVRIIMKDGEVHSFKKSDFIDLDEFVDMLKELQAPLEISEGQTNI